MKKRVFLLLVCLLTLAVSLCLFTACDEGGKNDDGTTDGGANVGGKEPCTHSYASLVTKEAGCETEGTLTYTCSLCGDSYTEAISAKGHTYSVEYAADSTHHYHLCGCGDKKDKAAHISSGAATATEDETCTVCGYVITPAAGITFKTLTVTGNTVYGKVSNTTTTFSFLNEISISGNAAFEVFRDIECNDVIRSKTASINVNDNTFYVLEYVNGNVKNIYEVVIRRRPIYEVTFDTAGGTAVDTQYIEEDSLATEPTTTLAGYTLAGWSHDFNTPITDDTEITASWTANTNTPYKVEYYFENVNKNGYVLDSTKTETRYGTTDTEITVENTTFDHFTYIASESTMTGTINSEGTLILKVYYTRNTYTVSNKNTSYGSIIGTGSYAYGQTVTITANPNLGYEFALWYDGETQLSTGNTYTFTVEKNVKLTAKFELKQEMLNFYFTSTATTCEITGIKDKTVTEIIIPDYVTSIGDYAFNFCDSLTSVMIGNSVETIGDYAFYNCYSLTSITIPNSVTSIGEWAFYNCESLTSVTFGNSVETIGDYAFQFCGSLTSVTFGNSVTSIGDRAFYHCESLTSITIPNSVTSIGDFAFTYCTSLTSVTIGNSVTSIGDDAFSYCRNLTSVTIGNSVTSIGDSAFCRCYKLVEVINKSSLTVTKGAWGDYGFVAYYALDVHNGDSKIVKNGDYLFYTYEEVNYLLGYVGTDTVRTLPSDYNGQNYRIYEYAFGDNDKITSVVIPDSVTSIGDSAFSYCEMLTSVMIGNSATSIGDEAFRCCTSLTRITVSDENTAYKSVDGNLYSKDGKTLIQYAIGKTATNIVIPDSVTLIDAYVFSGCESLTNITIPNSVTSIGDYAFSECPSLTSVTIGNSVESIGSGVFQNCTNLTSVTIPNSVTLIGDYAFRYCYKLVEVINKSSLNITTTSYGLDALEVHNGESKIVNKDGSLFYTVDGVNYLIDYVGTDTELTLSSDYNGETYQINKYAFYDNGKITSVVIPDSVTVIGYAAFYGCSSLTSITIPNSVTSIGEAAFRWCSSLTGVTIGNSVTVIGYDAFYGCSSLTSITIPNSVTSIGGYAFSDCYSLTSIKYRGTEEQWEAITKGNGWNNNTGTYTITYNYTGE